MVSKYKKRMGTYVLNQLEKPKKIHKWRHRTDHKYRDDHPDKWLGRQTVTLKGFDNEKDRLAVRIHQ